jgi:hypothetical protein
MEAQHAMSDRKVEVRDGPTVIGYVIVAAMGTAYCYRPDGTPIGAFADYAAAVRGLRERRAAA